MIWTIKATTRDNQNKIYQELTQRSHEIRELINYQTLLIDNQSDEILLKLGGLPNQSRKNISMYLAKQFPQAIIIERIN